MNARNLLIRCVALAAGAMTLWTAPVRWCGREADAWFVNAPGTTDWLALTVEKALDDRVGLSAFRTGSSQFDGEWLFGTYLMSGIGFGQVALADPSRREACGALMSRCIDRILDDDVRAFDEQMWREDPLDGIAGPNDHIAYLGYLNILLGLHRLVDPRSAYADLNDRITAKLLHGYRSSRIGLLESYPDEVYPVDNCAAIGSIGLHARATGEDHGEALRVITDTLKRRYVDPATGLLIQCVEPPTGEPIDAPRGSGTSLGLFFLSYADRVLAGELYQGIRRSLAGTLFGFGGIREYPRGFKDGRGDIDSGPILFGFGLSATGFSIAGSRMFEDAAMFRRLFATATLCGAPHDTDSGTTFVTGGPLGNAILFAMLTAPTKEVSP